MSRRHRSTTRDARRLRRPRGTAKAGLLVLLAGGTSVACLAVALRPRPLGATVPPEVAVGPARAAALGTIADVVRRSTGVLAVHRRGNGPFTDVVLHAYDAPRTGAVEASEVLVLTHSRTLRALFAWTLDREEADEAVARRVIPAGAFEDPAFARSWRDRPDVRRDVVPAGEGLLDLELLRAEGPGNAASPGWTLRLTWADGSADGTVTAEVPVDPAADGPSGRE